MNTTKQLFKRGFTLVELLVVIVVIGILASILIVSYKGIQAKAIDKTVQSDIDNFNTAEVNYGIKHGGAAKAYNSGSGVDKDFGLQVSGGNVIDIVSNGVDYCIRGYNPKGNKNSLSNSFIYESIPGACTSLPASSQGGASGPTSWVQVSVGQQYECGIASNSLAYCWGNNASGQFGNNSTASSSIPVPVDTSGVLSGKTILSISAGLNQTCAVASDNQAYCWGDNSEGELGNNTRTSSLIPVAVDTSGALSGKTILSISTGSQNTCAIASDNLAYCWGDDSTGSLGAAGTTSDSSVPVPVDTSGVLAGKTILFLQTSNIRSCALASDNQVYCWGANNVGQLGNNSKNNAFVPVAIDRSGVLAGKTIKALSPGVNSHSCVIASDNLPYCWGLNTNGQLGNNSQTNSSVPVAVVTNGALNNQFSLTISTGSGNSCVVAADNLPYCWGVGVNGELGNNTYPNYSTVPVAVMTSGALSGKSLLTTQIGQTDICTIASDAQNYCWGDNTNGQLGNGNTADSAVPVQVKLPSV